MQAGQAWLLLSTLLAAASLLVFALGPAQHWALAAGPEPWRLLSAGAAHWNALHLAGNLAGLAVIGWLGRRAALPDQAAVAWLLAGPLAHGMLWLHPHLPPYAGLSGWLHAGVAVAVIELLQRAGQDRRIGIGIGLGLLLKLLLEQPWGPLLRPDDWWGGATLPLAHACGAAAGLMAGALTLFWKIRKGEGRRCSSPSPPV
jgi:rhomboid family GlyGly-CTERM serine protease